MKNTFSTLFLLFSVLSFSWGQEADIKATVQDSLGESIIGASVMLTQKADSTLVGFGLTDNNGYFKINSVEKGEYFLQITYMGYRNHVEYVKMEGKEKDMGIIVLQEGNTLLEEVVVMADRIPILIKKDTLEYNAGSFNTKDNAVVEDLLRELPGVEVEEDGTIMAQGKKVEKVLVEGEEFFGNDPTVATKNLPADAVDKVQIYDDKTDEQKLSGMKGGKETKTMNLKLKEDKKQGYFGKAVVGGGTDKRYTTALNLNRFNESNQIAIVSKFNNINSAGFSINEYIDFMGGVEEAFNTMDNGDVNISSSSVPISFGRKNSNGNKTTSILGVNWGKKFSKTFKLNTNYAFNSVIDTSRVNSQRTNFIAQQDDYTTTAFNTKKSRFYQHKGNLKWAWEIDSTQSIILTNNLSFSTGSGNNFDRFSNTNTHKTTISKGENKNQNKKGDFNTSNRLLYRKRFDSGQSISTSTQFDFSNNNNEIATLSENDYFNAEGELIREMDINRKREIQGKRTYWRQRVNFVQPIGKKILWSNGVYAAEEKNTSDNETVDTHNGQEEKVEELSRDFTFKEMSQGLTSEMEYVQTKYDFSIGAELQRTSLSIQEKSNDLFKRPYWFVLPRADFGYNINKSSSIHLYYRAGTNIPNYEQLQPLRNNTNPLKITLGNPNLNPEYSHSFNFNYNMFDNFNFRSIFARLSHRITPNAIIQKTTINEKYEETTQAVNQGTRNTTSGSISYSTPLNFMKAKVRTRLNASYSSSPFWVNTVQAYRQQFSQGLSLTLSNKNRKNWDTSIRYSISNSQSTTTENNTQTTRFLNHELRGKVNYYFEKRWALGTTANYKTYSSSNFNQDNSLLIWNAFIEVTLFKNEKGILRLYAKDLLNQNRGVERMANAFYTLEQDSNNLGRYVMLQFTYKISFFGK